MKPIDGKLYLKGNPVSDTHEPDPADGVALFGAIDSNFSELSKKVTNVSDNFDARIGDVDEGLLIGDDLADLNANKPGTYVGQNGRVLTGEDAGDYAWDGSTWGFKSDLRSALTRADRSRLDRAATSPALLPALTQPSVLVKLLPHTEADPSRFMSVTVPVQGRQAAVVSLKRGSISSNAADVGLSQDAWELDEVEFADRALLYDRTSVAVLGNWPTDSTTMPGLLLLTTSTPGFARSAYVAGPVLRLGWIDVAGSARIEIEINGVLTDVLPAGQGTATLRVLNRALPEGGAVIVYRHAGTDGEPAYIVGVDVCDGDGFVPSLTRSATSGEVLDDDAPYIGAGVQSLVVSEAGGLRMGGGHGGVWRLAKPMLLIDGVEVDPESITTTTHLAGRHVALLEALTYHKATDPNDKANTLEDFATVLRVTEFFPNGYSCDMDIFVHDSGAAGSGQQVEDFLVANIPVPANMTHQRLPEAVELATAVPFTSPSLAATMFDPVKGHRVEATCEAQISSDDGAIDNRLLQNDGFLKYYRVAALNDDKKFFGRSRVKYRVRLDAPAIADPNANKNPVQIVAPVLADGDDATASTNAQAITDESAARAAADTTNANAITAEAAARAAAIASSSERARAAANHLLQRPGDAPLAYSADGAGAPGTLPAMAHGFVKITSVYPRSYHVDGVGSVTPIFTAWTTFAETSRVYEAGVEFRTTANGNTAADDDIELVLVQLGIDYSIVAQTSLRREAVAMSDGQQEWGVRFGVGTAFPLDTLTRYFRIGLIVHGAGSERDIAYLGHKRLDVAEEIARLDAKDAQLRAFLPDAARTRGLSKLQGALCDPFHQLVYVVMVGDSITWGANATGMEDSNPRDGTLSDPGNNSTCPSFVNLFRQALIERYLSGGKVVPTVTVANWPASPSGEREVTAVKDAIVLTPMDLFDDVTPIDNPGFTTFSEGLFQPTAVVNGPNRVQSRYILHSNDGGKRVGHSHRFTGDRFTLQFATLAASADYEILVNGISQGVFVTRSGVGASPLANGDNEREHIIPYVRDGLIEVIARRFTGASGTITLFCLGVKIKKTIHVSNRGLVGQTAWTLWKNNIEDASANGDGSLINEKDEFYFVQAGTNDPGKTANQAGTPLRLEKDLRRLVDALASNGNVVMMAPPPRTDTQATLWYGTEEVHGAVCNVARETGHDLIDHYSNFKSGDLSVLIDADQLHPTDAGHKVMADEMMRRLVSK